MKTFKYSAVLFFCLLSVSFYAGPVFTINIKLLESEADTICIGEVTSVKTIGKEKLLSSDGVNIGPYEAEVLRAQVSVHKVIKGTPANEITLECYRNLNAWIPGIAEGAYILFLKKKGGFFAPVKQPGYLIPVAHQALKNDNIIDVLKGTIATRNRRLIRPCIEALQQIISTNDFNNYALGLLKEKDPFIRGSALLSLIKTGDKTVLDEASKFSAAKHNDKEVDNLAKKIAIAIERK